MRLLWLLFLCLSLSVAEGRPKSATNPNPKPQTPDEGSTKLQKEDGNEKDETDEAAGGRPVTNPKPKTPDEGSNKLQEEDGNVKHETDEADWKLEFENGTTIKGVGSPPTVWHLVEPSEVIDNAKEGSKEPVAMVGVPLNNAPQAKEGKNTRSLITNRKAKEDTMKKELLQFCPCECSHQKAEPVCASDGITYDNKCRLTCAACKAGEKIEIVSQGKCKDSKRLLPSTHTQGGDTGKGDSKHLQNSTRQWGGWDRITRTLNNNLTHASSTHTQGGGIGKADPKHIQNSTRQGKNKSGGGTNEEEDKKIEDWWKKYQGKKGKRFRTPRKFKHDSKKGGDTGKGHSKHLQNSTRQFGLCDSCGSTIRLGVDG